MTYAKPFNVALFLVKVPDRVRVALLDDYLSRLRR